MVKITGALFVVNDLLLCAQWIYFGKVYKKKSDTAPLLNRNDAGEKKEQAKCISMTTGILIALWCIGLVVLCFEKEELASDIMCWASNMGYFLAR